MKKRFIVGNILILIILIAIFGGCAKEIETPSNPSATPYEKGKYYELYKITKYSYPQYQYFVFDNNHDVLDYGVIEKRWPEITMTNGLIKIRIGCGTACFESKY